jgi:hypothetical protein
MDPEINPSLVLPVDFLPKGLRPEDYDEEDSAPQRMLKDVAAAGVTSNEHLQLAPEAGDNTYSHAGHYFVKIRSGNSL